MYLYTSPVLCVPWPLSPSHQVKTTCSVLPLAGQTQEQREKELRPLITAKQYSDMEEDRTLLDSYLVPCFHCWKPPWLEVIVKQPVELEKLKGLVFWRHGRAPRILFWAGCLLAHYPNRITKTTLSKPHL